jgi:hypothetical protein
MKFHVGQRFNENNSSTYLVITSLSDADDVYYDIFYNNIVSRNNTIRGRLLESIIKDLYTEEKPIEWE